MFAMRSICSTKTPVRLLFIALCAAVSSTFAMASESTKYFSIKMQDKLIGYAVVRGESTRDAGSTRWKSESVTSLKVTLLGKERNTKLQFETVVAPETRQPISYRMTDTTNDVIRHVESDFDGTTAKTWTYRDGDPKGEPKTLELPEGTLILGSNNFAHWQWLLDAAKQRAVEERVELPVYLPDAGQMDQFELTLEGPQQTEIAGETRDCLAWKFEKAKLSVLVDAETNEFLRLDLAAQQTVIESTGSDVVKLAQKSAAEEILARHFAQSNVVFDDFMSVRALTVDLDATVIGSGVAGDPTGLSTVMQSFDGKKEVDKIRGKFIVKSVEYDASKSQSFPTSESDAMMDQWLKPSTYIESDHGPIVDKATALTREAKTRWDAVTAIGDWVHQEIAYTIADTPSARLAFEKREGDCGPHSTLMVAMLQSQGIPARLVGGLVYTPSFGGSFGQHAWVEVNMGESGWIAVDPTTGEFDRMSATHIKLFEGMGGVIPTSIKVLQYDPPNRESTESDFAEARPLAWELGKSYTFQYKQAGKELGAESFTIQEVDRDGNQALKLDAEVALKLNLLMTLKTNTSIVVGPNAKPISISQSLSAALQKVKIECDFQEGLVKQKISGTTNLEREVKLPGGTFCFDNNLMASWVLICSQLELTPGEALQINTYHPSTLKIIPLTLTPKKPAEFQIAGERVRCYECDVAPINNTFWISEDGRFLKVKQGNLEIELVPPVE